MLLRSVLLVAVSVAPALAADNPFAPPSAVAKLRTIGNENFIVRGPTRADSAAVLRLAEAVRGRIGDLGPCIVRWNACKNKNEWWLSPIDSEARSHHYVILDCPVEKLEDQLTAALTAARDATPRTTDGP